MKQPYWNLDLIHLSAESSAVYLDKEFILMDSLDGTVENESTSWEFINHPVKLSFTIVIFCVAGRMRIQLNLQDFELVANDILIAQEGTIGVYQGMDGNARIRHAACPCRRRGDIRKGMEENGTLRRGNQRLFHKPSASTVDAHGQHDCRRRRSGRQVAEGPDCPAAQNPGPHAFPRNDSCLSGL